MPRTSPQSLPATAVNGDADAELTTNAELTRDVELTRDEEDTDAFREIRASLIYSPEWGGVCFLG